MHFYGVLVMCFICDWTKFRGGLMTLWELLSVFHFCINDCSDINE